MSRTFLFSYEHQETTWVLELKADSPEDARKRLQRLASARLDGELVARIPLSSPLTLLTAAISRLRRNFMRSESTNQMP